MKTFDVNKSPAHNPFKVPEWYFSQFHDQFMARMAVMPPLHINVTPELRIVRWIPKLGVACVAGLLLLFSQLLPLSGNDDANHTLGANAAYREKMNEEQAFDYLMMADADNIENYAVDF